MAGGLILETTFLVDLERELAARKTGPAQALLQARSAEPLYITFTVAGELASGIGPNDRSRWEGFIAPFQVLGASPDVCWEYGKVFRYLEANGRLIGANDLWIAAAGLAYGKAVVTRNRKDFRKVPGLDVVGY
jgi:predicted nucleic acid-binding protein